MSQCCASISRIESMIYVLSYVNIICESGTLLSQCLIIKHDHSFTNT